jgi:pyrroline-5-carboxylate reductase
MMAAGFTLGQKATEADAGLVSKLLGASGQAVEVTEPLMDAVTGLSGSGPAFVARLIEAFTEAGIAQGLPAETAEALALATFEGTASLLRQRKMSPDELVTMVSSPNGTTVAGREVLESSQMKSIIAATVARAAERSRELGA